MRYLVATALLPLAGMVAQQPAFRAETRLVVIHARVRNARGELVTSLESGAFTVYENGKRQPITLFRRDDIPVSLGLLIDNSGSMRTLRSTVETAALGMARASNSEDEIFVVNFNDKVRIDVPIARQIRNQYTIAYAPLNQTLDGTYRAIHVAVAGSEHLSVRTRAGYRASQTNPDAAGPAKRPKGSG